MSQALYRQYRPKTFDDVIGQEVAVRTLRNAIERDRVAHAYLFTGTKGTGKTTLAKLLAKAMNCVNGPTVDPCGVCEECVAITEGRSMDVAEIDAASNTGIDDVREKIIRTVAFQPSKGTRRVYIIDEAHQLSKHAFNALLKTIEEPPDHVIFVFCTTETHMMMATVRDRCQRIGMRSPDSATLVEVLGKVCEQEGLSAEPAALQAIARAASGSFRNALGTLEMLATSFGSSFTRDDVLHHLGVVSEETLFQISDAILSENPGSALLVIEELTQSGSDLDQFARSLAEHMRGILLAKHNMSASAGVSDTARLEAQAAIADERRVLAAIDCIADAATRIRVGSDARISLETAIVRACQGLGLPLLAMRLARLEQQVVGGYGKPMPAQSAAATENPASAPAVPAPVAPAPAAPSAPKTPATAPTAVAPTPTPKPAPAPASTPPPAAPEVTELSDTEFAKHDEWWQQVLTKLGAQPALRPALNGLSIGSVSDGGLVVEATSPAALASQKAKDAIAQAAYEVTGRKLVVSVQQATETVPTTPAQNKPPVSAPQPKPESEPTNPDSAGQDAGVQNLMSIFDAVPVQSGSDEE